MPVLPARSTGVLISPMRDRAVVYDLATETAHQLNPTAGLLLETCDGETDTEELVARWSVDFGVDPEVLRADITAGLEVLDRCSLLGREALVERPEPPCGSDSPNAAGDLLGLVHPGDGSPHRVPQRRREAVGGDR